MLGRQDLCRRTVLAANEHGPCARDWRLPWARARHLANGRQNTLTHRNRMVIRDAAGFDLAVLGRQRGRIRDTVAAHMTLAWTATLSAMVEARRRKLPAYNAAATVMIAKLTGRVGAA